MEKVKIRAIEIAHGKNVVGNEYYLEHFKKQGKDVKHLFEEVMGRKYRYEIDPETESAITLARDASRAVLRKANLTGNDIDMIVYTGTLPEYATPISSLLINHFIEGKEECFCHDMNLNCIGMTYGLDLINRYITTNPKINKVLLVGSDALTVGLNPEKEANLGQFGDVSCAVILERTEEDCKLLDTKVKVSTTYIDSVTFPKCGFSHIFDAEKEDLYTYWKGAPAWWIDGIVNDIHTMLDDNNLSIEDVSMFCFTQIAYKNIVKFREELGISEEKSIYIGDKYGYTGTSSPFVALHEAINSGKIKHGDYIMLATAAAGGMHITELIKY